MPDIIKVHFESIAGGQTDSASTAGNLTSSLDDLERSLAPLVATWDGAAFDAYQVQRAAWKKSQQSLIDAMNYFATAFGNAHASYTAAESRNVSRFS